MARVLVVDDDPSFREVCGIVLRQAGHVVVAAASAREALAVLERTACELALVDLRLPDMSGLELLRALRARPCNLPVVIVTGYPAVEALKLGAADYVAKRPDPDHYTEVVARVLAGERTGHETLVASGSRRWAQAIGRVVRAPEDPRTETEWAKLVGASVETLRGWLRAADLPVKPSLDLARLLRAVRLARQCGCGVERFLQVADRRTRDRLLEAAGLAVGALPPTIEAVLARQELVTDAVALGELRRVLREHGVDLGG